MVPVYGPPVLPLLDFGAAAGKSETTSATMVGGGTILPHGSQAAWRAHGHPERRVIYAVGIFADDNP